MIIDIHAHTSRHQMRDLHTAKADLDDHAAVQEVGS